MTLAPRFAPSSWNCTLDTPAAAEAEAVTATLPETLEPVTGAVMDTVGGAGTATPVPDKLNGASEPEALLAIEMLELAAPAVLGAKVTCSVADFPAAIVAPAARPVAVNPLPGALTDEIVTVAVPELVTVEDNTLFFPTVTFPNGKLAGFSVSFPTGAAVPVPERVIVVGEAGSLLVMEMLPVSSSAEVGE